MNELDTHCRSSTPTDLGSAAVGVALVTAGLFWLFDIAERIAVI